VRTYVLKRLIFMAVTLVAITMVSYTMMRLAPGDPIRAQQLGAENAGMQDAAKKETLGDKLLREKYYLDKPAIIGYGCWLRDLVTRFDWGSSIVVGKGAPVMSVIRERIPPTLKINICAIILVYACALPIGIYAAVRRGKWDERAITTALFVLYSLPTFWVGLLLLMFFAGDRFLNVFPVAGLVPDPDKVWAVSYWRVLLETARHYVLPVFCLTYGGLAGLSRYMRVGVLEKMRQDYVRTARAKGLSEWNVLMKHVLRNSVIPMITIFAGLLPGLIAGSIIIEYIFSINGMGSLSILALTSRDYPVLMGLFTIGAVLTLLGILLSDLLLGVVDPRVSLESLE